MLIDRLDLMPAASAHGPSCRKATHVHLDIGASDATKQRAGKSYFSSTARCAIVLAGFGRAGIDTFEQERT
jgi:hypothetical protein